MRAKARTKAPRLALSDPATRCPRHGHGVVVQGEADQPIRALAEIRVGVSAQVEVGNESGDQKDCGQRSVRHIIDGPNSEIPRAVWTFAGPGPAFGGTGDANTAGLIHAASTTRQAAKAQLPQILRT